jgi:FixJ family two-component response regulator
MLSEEGFTVFVVDDDDSICKALKRLLRANGYAVKTFASAEDFLLSCPVHKEGCLVLDICLPGISGLDLYERFSLSNADYPVIFITAHDNPQWQKKAMDLDAAAYLQKPFDGQALLDAIDSAHDRLEDVARRRDLSDD